MTRLGMLVILIMNVNHRFWSQLRSSGWNTTTFSLSKYVLECNEKSNYKIKTLSFLFLGSIFATQRLVFWANSILSYILYCRGQIKPLPCPHWSPLGALFQFLNEQLQPFHMGVTFWAPWLLTAFNVIQDWSSEKASILNTTSLKEPWDIFVNWSGMVK